MAKSRTRAKPKATKGITPSYENRVPTYYANFANVTSTMREVFIDFCLLSPPHTVDVESQLIQAPVVARIIATPEFAQALKETLDTHLKKAEEREKASKAN